MILNDHMRDMIMEKCTTDELRLAAQENGMVSLRDGGEQFVEQGITTAEEIIRETILEG